MADIHPFRGIHYNQSLIKDMAAVICPPYDIISSQLQQELYLRSEYNFVRLEFGRELPQDTANDNKYTRSAATLEQWLKQDILQIDDMPAIYLHEQYFTHQGKRYNRRGIMAWVRLEEWDKKVIRPHEGTLAQPKSERLNLLWTLKAHISPIFALFEDQKQLVSKLLSAQKTKQPLISSDGAADEAHVVWAIRDPEVVHQISSILSQQPLYIADGHHRYESALMYQREKRTGSQSVSGDEPFNFVMMTLVDFSDAGLIILPPHRLVRGIPHSTLNELMPKLRSFFEIQELPLDIPGVWQKVDDLLNDASLKKTNGVRLALFGLSPGNLSILTLPDFTATSQMMPYFHSEIYKKLDVSIIDHVILEKLLGMSIETKSATLAYVYDRQDAVNRVLNQEYQLTFLLNPIKAETIKAIADASDRMPRKSTYFYPKLPSGLIFSKLT